LTTIFSSICPKTLSFCVKYQTSLAAELSKHRRAREAKEAAALAAKGKESEMKRVILDVHNSCYL
jgi:muconolactone delta-isomerase